MRNARSNTLPAPAGRCHPLAAAPRSRGDLEPAAGLMMAVAGALLLWAVPLCSWALLR